MEVLKESVMVEEMVSMNTNPPRPLSVLHAHSVIVQLLMVSECLSEEIERKRAPPSMEEGLVHRLTVVLEREKEERRKSRALMSEGADEESEVVITVKLEEVTKTEGEEVVTSMNDAELLNVNCEEVSESDFKDPPQMLIREDESVSCALGEQAI